MSSPVRVLVVEDDPTLREVLQEVLTARGLQVVTSSRGEEALHRAKEEPFDLIVADIRMEGINGLDTIEQARQIQPDIGSIVVSGFASEEETLRAVRLNVAGYLKKPFKVPELLELINNFLTERSEKLRQTKELRGLREALLWSLFQQGQWAERIHPGKLTRPAEVARGMARHLGFATEAARELSLGTLLRALEGLPEQGSMPAELEAALEPYSLLLEAWRGEKKDGLSALALRLCDQVEPDAELPPAQALPAETDPRLAQAYREFLAEGPQESSATPRSQGAPVAGGGASGGGGLLRLANALEQGGDFRGAGQAYAELSEKEGISTAKLQALLGLARVAVAQGATQTVEKAIAELLAVAEKMGPVTFALAEFEGARVLRRAGHPATAKLLDRAIKSLEKVNLVVPAASAVVAKARLVKTDDATLKRALAVLSSPVHLLEVLEQLETLLPDLVELGSIKPFAELDALTARLVGDYPQEVVTRLRRKELSLAARGYLVDRLEQQGETVAKDLLELLSADPNPEIGARCAALASKLGLSETLPVLRVYSLGAMEVTLGGERIDEKVWKTQKTKHLFARLVYNAPRSITVERLMEDFWPGSDDGRNNLNTAVSIIRKQLKPPNTGFDPLLRVGDTLGLHPDLPLWHDVEELKASAAQAKRLAEAGNLEASLSYLSRVARLYRGRYLEGCPMSWVTERQVTLENLAVDALVQLSAHRLAQHRYREALEYALRLLLLSPDHEGAHEIVMSAYVGLDQHDNAVSHYEAYRERLAREFASEPSVQAERLYQMARYGFQQGPGFTAS